MTTIKTDIDAQSEAGILPFDPVGSNTATNVQDAIELAALVGGGGGGGWGIQPINSGTSLASGILYVVSGATGDIPLTLPTTPTVGDHCAVYMEDYSSSQTATVDAGIGYTIGASGMGAQTHQIGGQGTFFIYRYIGGYVWATEQAQVTKQLRFKSSSFTLNKIYDNSVTYISNSSARTVTVPSDTAYFLPIGFQMDIVRYGTGSVTVVADTGVTINTASTLLLPDRYSRGVLTKIDVNEWLFSVAGAVTGTITDTINFLVMGDATADGGPGVISAGLKGYVEAPFTGTITRATLIADVSGSAVVDVWAAAYVGAPPTALNTITGAAKPTLTAAQKSQDATLSGWTTAITAGDILAFNVDSATAVKRLLISLSILKS